LIFGYFLHGRNNSEESQENSKTLWGRLTQDDQQRTANLSPRD
jgi:hypothetical protein